MPDRVDGATGWVFYAVLAAVFAALTNILAKVGVSDIHSNMAMWVRVVVVVLFLTPLIFIRGEWISPGTLAGKAWIFLILSGLATGASWMAYFKALQLAPASWVAPVDKLSVVLVMVLGVLFLGERLTLREWLGGTLIFAGALLIAWPKPASV